MNALGISWWRPCWWGGSHYGELTSRTGWLRDGDGDRRVVDSCSDRTAERYWESAPDLVMLLGQYVFSIFNVRDGYSAMASKCSRVPHAVPSTIYTDIAVCVHRAPADEGARGRGSTSEAAGLVLVCPAWWILRQTSPTRAAVPDPVCPLVPFPCILSCLGLCAPCARHVDRLGVWLVIGLAIYFGYSRKAQRAAG